MNKEELKKVLLSKPRLANKIWNGMWQGIFAAFFIIFGVAIVVWLFF